MVDKNSSSSLLEAIKNKLNKFDKKPAILPDSSSEGAVVNIANYFTADINSKNISQNIIDKTSINLDLQNNISSKNIENSSKNIKSSNEQNLDLDLDDESPNIKNLSSQFSIDNKIKEIAKEINNDISMEDFEEDVTNNDESQTISTNNNENIDPIELELQKLEQEILTKKQPINDISANNSSSQIDDNFKNYLDENFKNDIDIINKNISKINNSQDNDLINNSNISSDVLSNENLSKNINLEPENSDKIIDNSTKNSSPNNLSNLGFNFLNDPNRPFSPARDFLAKMESQNNARPLEKLYEEIVESPFKKNSSVDNVVNENSIKKINIDELNKSFAKDEIDNLKIDKFTKPVEEMQSKVVYHNEQKISSQNNFDVNNFSLNSSNNNQLNTENTNNNVKNFMENFNDESLNKSSKEINKTPLNSSNVIEKIDHNLIHQETIYQANDSIKKLIEAKNMIKNVNNFAQNETLSKIAISIMEPKLEKWLNENLPNMVEEIVRQEIDKIIPKE